MYIFVYFLSCKTSDSSNQEVHELKNEDTLKSNVKFYKNKPYDDPVITRLNNLLSFQDIEYNKMVQAGFRDYCNSIIVINFDLTIPKENLEFILEIETMLNKLFIKKFCNFFFESIVYENGNYEKGHVINSIKSAISENNDRVDLNLSHSNYVQNTSLKLSAIGECILKCNIPKNVQKTRKQNNCNVYICHNNLKNDYLTKIIQQMVDHIHKKPIIHKNTLFISFKYELNEIDFIIKELEMHIKGILELMGSKIDIFFVDIVIDNINTKNLYYMIETLTQTNILDLKNKILKADSRTIFTYNNDDQNNSDDENNIDYIHSLMSMIKISKGAISCSYLAYKYNIFTSDDEQCVDDKAHRISMVPHKDQFIIYLYRTQIINNNSKTVKYYFGSSSTSPKDFYVFSYNINMKNQVQTIDNDALEMLDLLFIKIKAVVARRETYQPKGFFNLKK
ncbi:hypothetical protein COBT_001332 [Conglomerata obtusa]